MSDTRRYGDDDIRKIFERAGSSEGTKPRTDISSEGLTLAELQVIGEEVGLSPVRIAEAAATLSIPSATERRNRLGVPVSVSRTVLLARLPVDYEWELLLTELRSTFGVLGKDGSKGNIREWTDGTLFAVIEPTETACRIRCGSSRPGAVLLNGAGFALILAAATMLLAMIMTDDLTAARALLPLTIGAAGVGTILYNGNRLKRWADKCAAQVDYIVNRARSLVSGESKAPLSSATNHASTEFDEPQRPLT
jgi:hypothetical protein